MGSAGAYAASWPQRLLSQPQPALLSKLVSAASPDPLMRGDADSLRGLSNSLASVRRAMHMNLQGLSDPMPHIHGNRIESQRHTSIALCKARLFHFAASGRAPNCHNLGVR